MASVGTAYVSIRVDTKSFEKSLGTALTRMTSRAEVAGNQIARNLTKGLKSTDWDSAFAGLRDSANKSSKDVVKSLDRVENKVISVAHYGDEAGSMLESSFRSAGRAANEMHSSLGMVSKELTKAKNAGKGIDFSGGAGRGSSVLRTAAGSAGFFARQLDDIAAKAPSANAVLSHLFNTAALGGTAMAALVGGLSAVGQGLFAVGANAAAMLPALSAATTGLIGLLQVGATVGIGMQGVGDAITAGFDAQTATAQAASDATQGLGDQVKKLVKPAKVSRDAIIAAKEAVKDAARAILDAKDDVADAAQGIKDAQEDLADAYRDAAWSAQDAARTVRRAEKDLADSQVRVTQAQLALNDARAEALEQLEDIGFAAEDAALGEERAEVALEEAYAQLVAVSELSPDNKMRQAAELAFREAELNLRQAKDAREDADAAQQEASESGVEGTEAMQSAHADLASAQEDQASAAQALADAQREQGRTAIADAEAIEAAERGVADAREAHRDALQGLLDAQNNYKDALGDVKEAQADYRQALKDAAAAAAEANKAIKANNLEIAKGPPEVDKFAEAMKNLSPSQREFVRRIIGMHDEYIAFRQAIAEPLFERLLTAMDKVNVAGKDGKTIMDVLTTGLTGTSVALGNVAIEAANLAAEDVFQASLADVMEANNKATENFGGAGVNLAGAFVQIADAASPLLVDLSKWVEKVTQGWQESVTARNKTGELGASFQTAADRVREFWGLGKELWNTLKILGEAANTAANRFGDIGRETKDVNEQGYITTLTDRLKEFNKQLEKKDLVGGFTNALNNMDSAAGAVKNVVDPLIKLGQDPKVGAAFDKIADSDAFDKLGEAAADAAPYLADIAVDILDILAALSESGSIKVFVETLSDITGFVKDIVMWLTNLPGAGVWLPIAGAILGVWRAVKLATGVFKFLFAGVAGDIRTFPGKIKTVTGAIGSIKPAVAKANPFGVGKGVADAMAQGISGSTPKVQTRIQRLAASVSSNKAKMRTNGQQLGVAVGLGLVLGLETMTARIISAGVAAGRAVIEGVQTGSGTQSPSKLTIKSGKDVMAGMQIGLKAGTPAAVATATTSGKTIGTAVGTGTAAGVAGSAGKVTGSMTMMTSGSKVAAAGMKVAGGAARVMGTAFNLAMGPIGMIAMIVLPLLWPLLKKLEEKTGIFSATLDVLKGALSKVGDAFKWLWDKIKELFGWVQANWPLLLTILTGPIGLAVSQIIKHWDDIKAAVSAAVDFVTGLFTGMWDGITAGWDAIMEFFNGLWTNHLQPIIQSIIDNVTGLLTGIWDGIKDAWWTLVAWSDILEDWVGDKIQKLVDAAKEVLKNIWKVIGDKWDALVAWASNLGSSISGKISKLVSDVGEWLSGIWSKIGDKWDRLIEWADNLGSSIAGKISKLVTDVGNGLADIWAKIGEKWDKVVLWADGLWDSISGKIGAFVKSFSDKIAGIWDGITGGFKTAIEWVLGKINTYLIGGINNILEKVGAGQIGEISVGIGEPPALAEGGPVRGPGGPTDDKVLIRASPGEYVLPARSARALGPTALEHMRTTGTLPMGDIGSMFGSVWHAATSVVDAMSNGAEYAMKWVLGNITSKLPDNIIGRIIEGILSWAADKMTGWGAKKDEELAAKAGASVFVPDPTNPTGVGSWKGGIFTRRFVAHMQAAEKIAGVSIVVIQGGFRPATSYSGTSHQGDALDTIVSAALIRALRRVGIAAGDRTGLGNWGPHVHAIPGPAAGRAGGSAIYQWADYMARGGASQPLNSTWGLAKGGIVSASRGGLMALIGEGGRDERVTPLDREGFSPAERQMLALMEQKMTGGGDTYHIQPSTPVNEAQLADMVARRVSWNRRRGAGV